MKHLFIKLLKIPFDLFFSEKIPIINASDAISAIEAKKVINNANKAIVQICNSSINTVISKLKKINKTPSIY